MRRTAALTCALAALALVGAGAAAAANGGLTPASPVSPNVERVEDTYYFMLVFTGAIFLLVQGALLVFILRFRRRGRDPEAEGPQIRGNTRLELIWTVVPVLILVAIGAFVFYKIPGIKNVPSARAAGGRLEVRVEGRQFYWEFIYPNGTIAVNRLRAPVGRVVRLAITAPDHDVNHSWWVPPVGGKFDAIPGQRTTTWFRAKRTGVFEGQCAEFCGIQHAAMLASIEVMPAAEFDRWLDEERRRQLARRSDLGADTYAGACAPCHLMNGEGLIGPPLAGNAIVNDAEDVRRVVRQGQGEMPAVGKGWPPTQMDALTRYLKRRFAPEGGGGGG